MFFLCDNFPTCVCVYSFKLGLISNFLYHNRETRFLNNLKFPNLTYMELILKQDHNRQKWKLLLEVLKSSPKLQNIIIHEVLLMSSIFLLPQSFFTNFILK